MQLEYIKLGLSLLWVITVGLVATAVDMSWSGRMALTGFGILPPLVVVMLWNEPKQTMSESIREPRS